MSLTADEVAKWGSSDSTLEQFAYMMFNALVVHHVTLLDAASLEALPNGGFLLVDREMILSRDFSFTAAYLATPGRDITDEEARQWRFPRFSPDFEFPGLKDCVLIQRHMLRLPRDDRTWNELTHAERLHVTIGYLSVLGPVHQYMAQIRRRVRQMDRRMETPSAKRGLGHMH